LPLFVQLMGKNVRNNFLEPRASTGETGRRELLHFGLQYCNLGLPTVHVS
jgi:hypothetical protein